MPSSKACIKKICINQDGSEQTAFSFICHVIGEICFMKALHFFLFLYCILNTREAGRILESFANLWLRLGFVYMPRQLPRV